MSNNCSYVYSPQLMFQMTHHPLVSLFTISWTIILSQVLYLWCLSLSIANSSTIAAVVSILCIMICMVTVAVVCIYNKARMKKYYRRWTLTINERWAIIVRLLLKLITYSRQKIREATNPIETKNTYKRSIHTLNSGKYTTYSTTSIKIIS